MKYHIEYLSKYENISYSHSGIFVPWVVDIEAPDVETAISSAKFLFPDRIILNIRCEEIEREQERQRTEQEKKRKIARYVEENSRAKEEIARLKEDIARRNRLLTELEE